MDFQKSPNIDYFFQALTSPQITEMSGGSIPQMTPEQAAGLIGSWIVETGDPSLMNLDVVEHGSGRGRGLSQYTGVRRVPYDVARHKAMAAGEDVNSAQWQLKYFADEYAGRHDVGGRSLIGWTKSLEGLAPGQTPSQYARTITGSAAEGKGYFRPGVPHLDKRSAAAESVFKAYQPAPAPASTPAPAKAPSSGSEGNPMINAIMGGLNVLGIPLPQ